MRLRNRASVALGALAIFACAPSVGKSDNATTQTSTDSLVLERTVCFGFCPAYRLRLSSADEVRFESHNRGDSARVASDTVARGTYATLISRARKIGFYDLPAEILKDSALCHNRATDHPTVITTIYSGASTKQVSDYHGCFETVEHEVLAPIQKLRAFENEIDSAVHSSRWVRPNTRAK